MKKIAVFLMIVFTGKFALLHGQVAINTDGSDPDPSAVLDVQATDKGMLIPRMLASQRDAISDPVQGLLVFVTDENAFYYYDGSNWILASADNLGDHKARRNLQMQGHWISADGDDEGIYVYDNGWVGINTNVSTPPAMLHVSGDDPDLMLNMPSSSPFNMVEVRFATDDTIRTNMYFLKSDNNFYLVQKVNSDDLSEGKMMFYTSGGNAMSILQNKYVGINQEDPQYQLDVQGKVRHGNALYFYSDSASTGTRRWFFRKLGSRYGDGIYIGAGGLTLIGSGESPSAVANDDDAPSSATEVLILASDGEGVKESIKFITNLDDGWDSRVEAMTILGDGRVGIGTNSPIGKLTVRYRGPLLQLINSTTDHTWEFYTGGSVGDDGLGIFDRTNSVYRVAIDSLGKVGIGTTLPGGKLTVRDRGKILELINSASGHTWDFVSGDTLGDHGLGLYDKNADAFRLSIDANGNVGVGTPVPDAGLHVVMSAGTENVRFERNEDTQVGASLSGRRSRGTPANRTALQQDDVMTGINAWGWDGDEYHISSYMRMHVDGTVSDNEMPGRIVFATRKAGEFEPYPRMVIKNDGLVGIGTESPQAKLHMLLTSEANVRIERVGDGLTGASLAGWRASGTPDAKTAVSDGQVITGLVGKGFDGSVYVTAARIKYIVDGTVSDGNVPAKIIFSTAPEGGVVTDRMVIRSNGNVGIGTSDPQRKLHVNALLRLEPTTRPDDAGKGDIYYDQNDNKIYYYNGTDWIEM